MDVAAATATVDEILAAAAIVADMAAMEMAMVMEARETVMGTPTMMAMVTTMERRTAMAAATVTSMPAVIEVAARSHSVVI